MATASACASGAPSDGRAKDRTIARSCRPIIRGRPLERPTDRRWRRLALAAPLLLLASARLGAQSEPSMFERLNLDRLRLTSLGGAYGIVKPTQTERTNSYAVFADYGEIVPR